MKTIIVCSLNDPAGSNIRERLLERFPFDETPEFFGSSPVYQWSDKILVASQADIVFVDGLDERYPDSRFVFISRHKAESGIPSLTAHFTGNFGEPGFGGNSGEIARYSPSILKNYFTEINALRSSIPSAYNITLEATHHGPTGLKSPIMFAELGSSDEQWRDTSAAAQIADALIKALDSNRKFDKCAIAIGGTHYSDKFNETEINSEFALGPIVPKYALEYFDEAMLNQILSKSDQPMKYALIDYKGLGKFKGKALKVVEDSGLEQVKA